MSEPADSPTARERRGALRFLRWPLIIVGAVVIIGAVAWFWTQSGKAMTTDNAYVQIAKAPVAPSIGGRVTDVFVHENQLVRRGQVLFRLDPRDFQASVEQAQAAVSNAELQVRADQAEYQRQLTLVQAAREQVDYTSREAARMRELYKAGVASQQQVDEAENAARQARQQLASAQQEANRALANLGGNAKLALANHPSVAQARAQLERARLNVSYTEVVAPADGIVTRVDQMPVGTYLNPSQTGFWLLTGAPWIEANFKEDQLTKMRVGQPVQIEIDAYPDLELTGHVASFSPVTGAGLSALPAQNATGNWVKVVQRLPVRIAFDKDPGIAGKAGLSAHVKVDVTAPGRPG